MKTTRPVKSTIIAENLLHAKDAPFGEPFVCKKPDGRRDNRLLMRLKPTGFLLNSTVIGDVINRNDIIVCDLDKGTVYCTRGDSEIELLQTELIWDYQDKTESKGDKK